CARGDYGYDDGPWFAYW
nr:immunoglobulin heavy chain junction region [Mus musculus]MBK4195204.1 immunoglobulin heavy chain junction region [Mus musculus]